MSDYQFFYQQFYLYKIYLQKLRQKLKKNEPILSINLTEKRKKVEQLGWVERAFLERILPDTLRLSIIERKPVALLQTQKGHQLIDQNGETIAGAAPETFGHLPVVWHMPVVWHLPVVWHRLEWLRCREEEQPQGQKFQTGSKEVSASI